MTTTRVDIEELEPTRSEKLLAVVLAVFLLIAGVWAYQRIDDAVTNDEQRVVLGSPEDRSALARLDQAQARLSEAFIQEATARDDLELSREAYRTALDAGRAARPARSKTTTGGRSGLSRGLGPPFGVLRTRCKQPVLPPTLRLAASTLRPEAGRTGRSWSRSPFAWH
jgi:hypothetical protein